MIEQRLINELEFRQRLGGISHPTFWKMQQKHGFPQHVKIGRRHMWVLSEATIFIENYIATYRKNLVVFSRQQSKTTINPY